MTAIDTINLILYILISFALLQGATWFGRRALKLDRTEREQVLQRQIDQLMEKAQDQEEEIADLRRQLRLVMGQYEEAIGRLSKLQETNHDLQNDNQQLRSQINNLSSGYVMRDNRPEKILLLLVGNDDVGLGLDAASLRAVRSETGLEIQEIQDPSPQKLKQALDRARMRRDHIYLHMAIRTDDEGYQIGNEIVDAAWLSTILSGVLVLLVAGTNSDQIGDFLGVVPYVVTMNGSVSHRDAALFCRAFWTEIGLGVGPTLALRRALERAPSTIREQIIKHWN